MQPCREKILLISLVILCAVRTSAQSPAGISSGLKCWLRADAPATLGITGGLMDSWTYANDNTRSFASAGSDRAALAPATLNFLPSLLFGGSQMMDGPTGVNAPLGAGDDDYSVFAVWRTTSGNAFQRVWSQRHLGPSQSADGVSLASWNNGLYGDQVEAIPYSHTVTRAYTTGAWNISQLNLLNQPLNDLEIADDRNLSTGILQLNTDNTATDGAALRTLADGLSRLGARDNDGEEPLTGNIAELIIYDRPITAVERIRVFSYLSLKYGIPVRTDLLSSGSAVVWNAAANTAYNNAVFGIGRDDNAGLMLTHSNSIITGSGDGTGQPGSANIILSNPTSLDNGDYLVIGNDNGNLTETTANLPATATANARRLARQWKVQRTGDPGAIDCSIDLAGITTTGTIGNNTSFLLMIDQDGDGSFATGTPLYYNPSAAFGTKLIFTGIPLANNAVFALVTMASFTNIAIASATGWSLSGNTGTTPGAQFLGTTDNQRLVFKTGNTEYMTILPSGNVGIGTATPQTALAVNGDILAKKIRVTPNGWPDYVFEKDYRLPPLKDIAAFVQQYHHLPGIATAAAIEKEGLDLGGHQAAILKKMEELTLYLVEQDKKIQELTRQLQIQQATVNRLNACNAPWQWICTIETPVWLLY